ncbi:hypothetical protein ACIGW0_31640 [Streptomyces bikiniensis]|uniref:Uncharacterized protein n=1 Tax=Streptomyces bikiniensis TaxID=1896 RepID=A0ABW8D241_STRBI
MEHPHYVMEIDGEIREWSAEDMQRLQEAVNAALGRMHAAGQLWSISTTEEAI